jgi:hypothetical protein
MAGPVRTTLVMVLTLAVTAATYTRASAAPDTTGGRAGCTRDCAATYTRASAAQDSDQSCPPAAPSIVPPREGAASVTGHVPLPVSTSFSVTITVVMRELVERQGGLVARDRIFQQVVVQNFTGSGKFVAPLDTPLLAGQIVQAIGSTPAEEAGQQPTLTPPCREEVTAVGDWGRVRAYFAGGGIFSKEHEDFSQIDPALTFVMDTNWWSAVDPESPAGIALLADRNAAQKTRRFRPRAINGYFGVRLTSVPVAPQAGGQAEEDGGGTGEAATDTTSADAFLKSRKAVLVETGAYVPFYSGGMVWTDERTRERHALFIAPVARVGILTNTGANGSSEEARRFGEDDVFRYWGIGVGIGFMKLSYSTNRASEVVSYLHAIVGKAENFETRKVTGTDDQGEPLFGPPKAGRRIMVEGRLKIPESVFQVGFDANLGRGRDDLRFIFGMRFDLGEMLEKIGRAGLR